MPSTFDLAVEAGATFHRLLPGLARGGESLQSARRRQRRRRNGTEIMEALDLGADVMKVFRPRGRPGVLRQRVGARSRDSI